MIKKIIVTIAVAVVLSGCGGPAKRNSWQNEKDFKKRRTIYYNEFVEGGGIKNKRMKINKQEDI